MIAVLAGPEYAYLHITLMHRFTYLLLEGEKIEMDVNPDEIKLNPLLGIKETPGFKLKWGYIQHDLISEITTGFDIKWMNMNIAFRR